MKLDQLPCVVTELSPYINPPPKYGYALTSNYAPQLWGALGVTNCCGAATIRGVVHSTEFLIELYRYSARTVFHFVGFHSGAYGDNSDSVRMRIIVSEFNTQVKGFAELTLHIVNNKECLLILRSVNHEKLAEFLGRKPV